MKLPHKNIITEKKFADIATNLVSNFSESEVPRSMENIFKSKICTKSSITKNNIVEVSKNLSSKFDTKDVNISGWKAIFDSQACSKGIIDANNLLRIVENIIKSLPTDIHSKSNKILFLEAISNSNACKSEIINNYNVVAVLNSLSKLFTRDDSKKFLLTTVLNSKACTKKFLGVDEIKNIIDHSNVSSSEKEKVFETIKKTAACKDLNALEVQQIKNFCNTKK